MFYQTFTPNKTLNKKANAAKRVASKLLYKTFGTNKHSQWDEWTFDPIVGGKSWLKNGYYVSGTIVGERYTSTVTVALSKKGTPIRYAHTWRSDSDPGSGVLEEGFHYGTRVTKGMKGLKKHIDYMTSIYDYFIINMAFRYTAPRDTDSLYLASQIDSMPGADSRKNSSMGAVFTVAGERTETYFS